jgi:hypothetical protein
LRECSLDDDVGAMLAIIAVLPEPMKESFSTFIHSIKTKDCCIPLISHLRKLAAPERRVPRVHIHGADAPARQLQPKHSRRRRAIHSLSASSDLLISAPSSRVFLSLW